MSLFKTFLLLALTIFPLLYFNVFGFFGEKEGETEPGPGNTRIPVWLQLSHRQSGILNFDFEPLDPAEIEAAAAGSDDETGEELPSAGTVITTPKPNPTGSPYEPGTLDDMLWQQRQRILSGGGVSRPKPTVPGSPYEPGTLDDMLWQHKQRNPQP